MHMPGKLDGGFAARRGPGTVAPPARAQTSSPSHPAFSGGRWLRCSSKQQIQIICYVLLRSLYLDPLSNHPPVCQQPNSFPGSEAAHKAGVERAGRDAIPVGALWTGLGFVCLQLNTSRGHCAEKPKRRWGKPPWGLICTTILNFHPYAPPPHPGLALQKK